MFCWIVCDWNRRIYGVFTTQEKAEAAIVKLEQETHIGFNLVAVPFELVNDFGTLLP
jgi:hypothetical protein